MSDRTTSPVAPQGESPASTPDATPEAQLSVQATEAAAQAAADEAQRRKAADDTLKAAGKAVAKGEKAYRAGLLEAGRLADVYCHQRMALGDKRAAAVQALEGEFARFASDAVDVNRLVGVYHAWRLLAEEAGLDRKAEAVPYGHYRDAWCLVVERADKDTAAESWRLLPGLETECKAAFAEAVGAALSRAAAVDKARGLVRQHAERQAAETRAAAAAKAQTETDAKAAAAATLAAEAQAKAAADQAAQAVATATDAEREERTRLAEAAKAELLAKQREHTAAVEAAALAAQQKARAESDAKAAADRQAKLDAKEAARVAKASGQKAAPVATQASAAPAEPRLTRAENLLAVGKAATVKDAAEMAAGIVSGHDAPDDVLAELLRQLHRRADVSRVGKRACEAALVVLERGERTAPVTVNAALEARGGVQVNGAVAVPA